MNASARGRISGGGGHGRRLCLPGMDMKPRNLPATAQPMTGAIWTKLLLLGAIWGGSFFFARVAVMELPPLVLVLLRVSIAAAALLLYLAWRGPALSPALPQWGAFLALALLNNVIPFTLIFLGQTVLGAGLAAVLNATTPFWTALIANFATTDERLSLGKAAGILLGVGGTAIMIGPGVAAGIGGPAWAKFALVGGALSYAFAALYARRFRDMPPALVASAQLTASTVVMTPVVLLNYGLGPLFDASATAWAAVLALALLSTSYGYILYFRIIAEAGATNASLVTLIVPVGAILLGAVFLGERLESFEFAGMTVIAAGLVVIDGRLLQRR